MNPADRQAVAIAFGMALRDTRVEQAHLTQAEVERRTHLAQNYVSLLELGGRCPTLVVIIELARALKVSPLCLVQDTLDRLAVSYEGLKPFTLEKEDLSC